MEEIWSVFKIITSKSTGRPKHIWEENNIETSVKTRNSVDSAQDRYCSRALVNVALNHWVPLTMELLSKPKCDFF